MQWNKVTVIMNFDEIVFLYSNQDEEENKEDDIKEEKKAQSSRSVKSFIQTVTLHSTVTKTQCYKIKYNKNELSYRIYFLFLYFLIICHI